MRNDKKAKMNESLDAVIETSKDIRNYLLDDSVSDDEKKERLKILKTALDANKNIVSASCVLVSIESLVK